MYKAALIFDFPKILVKTGVRFDLPEGILQKVIINLCGMTVLRKSTDVQLNKLQQKKQFKERNVGTKPGCSF